MSRDPFLLPSQRFHSLETAVVWVQLRLIFFLQVFSIIISRDNLNLKIGGSKAELINISSRSEGYNVETLSNKAQRKKKKFDEIIMSDK